MTYYAKGKKMWRYPSNSTIERLKKEGYRLDHIKNYPSVQKKWAFPYERAYLYSLVYNAQIIPIA